MHSALWTPLSKNPLDNAGYVICVCVCAVRSGRRPGAAGPLGRDAGEVLQPEDSLPVVAEVQHPQISTSPGGVGNTAKPPGAPSVSDKTRTLSYKKIT